MFIAMNRFQVRAGREADFETQWRSRETYLQDVPGFVSFALLKNEPMPAGHGAPHGHEHAHDDHGHSHESHAHEHGPGDEHTHAHHGANETEHSHGHAHEATAFTEYLSHTTWRSRADFDAWRNSESFRLAHAQGSIEGVLVGPPVPSLYNAVLEETPATRPTG
jgi:heme-degrading monooxygenase HmoA